MHVRLCSVTRHGNTYQYAQLVESVRRDRDGVPVHQVIANLGRVTDPVQLENLKAAFAANRSGQRLGPVVASAGESVSQPERLRRPQAILRYLDAAVVVEILRQTGLTEEFDRLLPGEQSEVDPERMVTTLVAQRCLDPQSKLGDSSLVPSHGAARAARSFASSIQQHPDSSRAGRARERRA
jgi:hypothetical protein